VLVTGHCGYIGAVLVPMLLEAGYDVVGVDSDLYRGCDFGDRALARVPTLADDIRAIGLNELAGVRAVVHLAALSNDALGELDPEVTYDINW
jgi:nucleoside-diphosphate-sugar epimerase